MLTSPLKTSPFDAVDIVFGGKVGRGGFGVVLVGPGVLDEVRVDELLAGRLVDVKEPRP